MRKPAFCICENKDTDQLCGYIAADQRLCFRYIVCTTTLLPKSKISSIWPSSVAVQPCWCQTWLEILKTGFLMTWLIYGLISYSEWLVQRRWLKGYKTKWKKREEREEKIFQHVGKTSKPVERVYVWGNATTGALGKSYEPITFTCLCDFLCL